MYSALAYSQSDKAQYMPFANKNSIQLELGGHGFAYSFNYERILINGKKYKTAGQLGIAYYPPKTDVIKLWIPLVLNEIRSFGNHHAEIGIGYVFTDETNLVLVNGEFKQRLVGFITARLGYRYQKPDGRLIFRTGFTPFMENWSHPQFYASGGLSIGYNF